MPRSSRARDARLRAVYAAIEAAYLDHVQKFIDERIAPRAFEIHAIDVPPLTDMVIGAKIERQEAPHRILLAKGFHLLVKCLFGIRLRDIDCGFRLIRRRLVESVLDEVRDLPYSFWAEFTVISSLAGFRIVEVPVSHRGRLQGGTTIYQPRGLPKIVFRQALGLLRLRKRMAVQLKHRAGPVS